MLSREQEKELYNLRHRQARLETGLCLVEGEKVIAMAGSAVRFSFTRDDTKRFDRIVTTETPQSVAAVAEIPRWSEEDIVRMPVVVVLDGVQDPGNVGAILRLCLAFDASVVLVESADPSGPKVVRSSVGAMFVVPWSEQARFDVVPWIQSLGRPIFRLERMEEAASALPVEPCVLIVGSEGQGIRLDVAGTSLSITHSDVLESLNVGHALAIVLHAAYVSR